MRKAIMAVIVILMLVAVGGYLFFFIDTDPTPSPTQFGSWGTKLNLIYEDGTERAIGSPMAIYDDGKLLTSFAYELYGKAVGTTEKNIAVRFSDFRADWVIKQGSTTKHTYSDYFGENPNCPHIAPISDVNFPVDGNWHRIVRYLTTGTCASGQACACIIPSGFADGVYTITLNPVGSISYNPDGMGWRTATLPDPVSLNVEIIGLKVYFKQGEY